MGKTSASEGKGLCTMFMTIAASSLKSSAFSKMPAIKEMEDAKNFTGLNTSWTMMSDMLTNSITGHHLMNRYPDINDIAILKIVSNKKIPPINHMRRILFHDLSLR
jgi:hypothetical protein